MTVVPDAWRLPPVRVVFDLGGGAEAVAWFDALGEIVDPERVERLEAEHAAAAEALNPSPECANIAP